MEPQRTWCGSYQTKARGVGLFVNVSVQGAQECSHRRTSTHFYCNRIHWHTLFGMHDVFQTIRGFLWGHSMLSWFRCYWVTVSSVREQCFIMTFETKVNLAIGSFWPLAYINNSVPTNVHVCPTLGKSQHLRQNNIYTHCLLGPGVGFFKRQK